MAEKKTVAKRAKTAKAADQTKVKTTKKPFSVRDWLIVSLMINLALGFALLVSLSNPTTYRDATAGYTVTIPAGWIRNDDNSSFRMTVGDPANPDGEIFVYGQRQVQPTFYDQPDASIDELFDTITQTINDGQNQFLPGNLRFENNEFTAEQITRDDGSRGIFVTYTGTDGEREMRGEHLLIVTQTGGVQNVVAIAEASQWDNAEFRVAVDKVFNSFETE